MEALAHRLLATAEATPDAVAIVDGDRSMSYAAFAMDAACFAAMLRNSGMRAGDRVALLLPNCLEAAVACYGAWLGGCVVVPLNAQGRVRELQGWLRHARPRLLVHAADNPDIDAALLEIDEPPARVLVRAPGGREAAGGATTWQAAMVATDPLPGQLLSRPPLHAVAAIVYTSGTTGAPKGVTLTHDNFAANVDAIVAYLGLCRADSTVTVLPFYYSYGASVLHTHLAVGARVVLEPNVVFPQVLAETLARERPTGFSGVASTFALLLDRVDLGAHDLSSLRYLTQAGGPMPQALARRLRAALPDARFFMMYGQTEATARLAWLPPDRFDEKSGAVGKAIAGVRIEVRDDAGNVLPAGMSGEVWVRGRNVMSGYWNDPVATATVLRDGWLRTGDMGRLDEDGYLFLDGRRCDMVKTGAHRVHPADVEEALCELEGVAEAAVAGVPDPVLGQVVKAFVVVASGHPLDAAMVRAHCRARLAPYKVPRYVDFVPALPRTASGKVRRAVLNEPVAMQEFP